MCCTLGSVKRNQNHIFQKFHTKKVFKKSAFANTLSRNLFECIQNLIQNCVEIIFSAHTSFKSNILIVFFHFFENVLDIRVFFQGDQPNSVLRSQHKGSVYSSYEYNLHKLITGFQQSHVEVKTIRRANYNSTILYNKKLRTLLCFLFPISLYDTFCNVHLTICCLC